MFFKDILINVFYSLNWNEQNRYLNQLLGEKNASSDIASDSEDENWLPEGSLYHKELGIDTENEIQNSSDFEPEGK